MGLGGALDVVCINHGRYEETPFDETDATAWLDSFERIMRLNLHAPAALAHRVYIPAAARALTSRSTAARVR